MGDAVNAENYCQLLGHLKERIRKKRPHHWARIDPEDPLSNRSFFLHHDNVSPHTCVITLALLGESGIQMIAHLPYSPDLAPCDFFLFPYMKKKLRGQCFRNLDTLKEAVMNLLKETPKETFQDAILQLPIHWQKCVLAGGGYFEGDHLGRDLELVEMSSSSSAESEAEDN